MGPVQLNILSVFDSIQSITIDTIVMSCTSPQSHHFLCFWFLFRKLLRSARLHQCAGRFVGRRQDGTEIGRHTSGGFDFGTMYAVCGVYGCFQQRLLYLWVSSSFYRSLQFPTRCTGHWMFCRLPGRGMKVWAPGAEGSVSRRTEKTPLFQRGLHNFTIFYLHISVILPALSHHLPHIHRNGARRRARPYASAISGNIR